MNEKEMGRIAMEKEEIERENECVRKGEREGGEGDGVVKILLAPATAHLWKVAAMS
jgi:hypothetical protein